MHSNTQTGGPAPEPADAEISFSTLFGALVRAWPSLLFIPLVVGGLVFALTSLMSPVYQAESVLLVESQESSLTRGEGQAAPDLTRAVLDEQSVRSQVEVLASVEIANRVIGKLGLEDVSEYSGVGGDSGFSLLSLLFGVSENEAARSRQQRTLDAFEERLTVYNVQGSRVIGIRAESGDPARAADVANAVASVYLEFQSQAKRVVTGEAADYLSQEVEGLREKVAEAEQRVADFRSRADLFVGEQDTALSSQQLSELNSRIVQAEADAAQERARADRLKSLLDTGQSIETIPEIAADPFVQIMRQREAAIKAEIAERSVTLLSGHPVMQALNGQLADVRAQIRQGAREVLSSLEKNVQIAADRVINLKARLNELKAGVARNTSADVQLKGLEREAEAQRALLETYLRRYREALSRQGGDYSPPDARIIARASPPIKPAFPNVPLFTVAAAVASGLLVAVIIVLRALLSGAAISPVVQASPRVEPSPANVRSGEGHPRRAETGLQPAALPKAAATKDQPLSRMIEESAVRVPAPEYHMSEEYYSGGAESLEDDIDHFTGQKLRMRAYDFLPYSRRQHLVRPSGTVGTDEYTRLISANAGHTDPVHVIYAVADPADAAECSLKFARQVAELGTRSIVVDLGLLDGPSNLTGLSDIITGAAEISEAIHRDRDSLAHLMACGREKLDYGEDDNLASLLKMLKALSGVYPLTFVNGGAAQDTLDLLGPVMASGGHPTFVVTDETEEDVIGEIRSAFEGTGLNRPTFVNISTAGEDENSPADGDAGSEQSAA